MAVVVDEGGEAGGVGEDLEQGGGVELGGGLDGHQQDDEGSLDHRPDLQPAVGDSVCAAVRLTGPLKCLRGQVDQHVALAGEVAEERGPAHLGLGDHVLDPGRDEPVGLEAAQRDLVDAVALVDSAGLGRRRGETDRVVVALAVSDQRRTACLDPRTHIQYGIAMKAILNIALARGAC